MTAKDIMTIIDSLKENIKDNDYLQISNMLKKINSQEKLYLITIVHPVLEVRNTLEMRQSSFYAYLKKCECYNCIHHNKCYYEELYTGTGNLKKYNIEVLKLINNDLKLFLKDIIIGCVKFKFQNICISSVIATEVPDDLSSETSSDEYDSE